MGSAGREADEAGELFREAMRGATPLAGRHRAPVRAPSGAARRPRESSAERESVSVNASLYIEDGSGRASGVSRKTVRELAAGALPQASLDLHRHTSAVARERLARFLGESRAAGLRTVLVITGKGRADDERSGLASHERLRDLVPSWLSGPLAAGVLAFTPARAEHGGEGALYVRLRQL